MKKRLKGLAAIWLAVLMMCAAVMPVAAESVMVYTGETALIKGGGYYPYEYAELTLDKALNTQQNILSVLNAPDDGAVLNGWKLWNGYGRVGGKLGVENPVGPVEIAKNGSINAATFNAVEDALLEPIWDVKYRIGQQPEEDNPTVVGQVKVNDEWKNDTETQVDVAYQWCKVITEVDVYDVVGEEPVGNQIKGEIATWGTPYGSYADRVWSGVNATGNGIYELVVSFDVNAGDQITVTLPTDFRGAVFSYVDYDPVNYTGNSGVYTYTAESSGTHTLNIGESNAPYNATITVTRSETTYPAVEGQTGNVLDRTWGLEKGTYACRLTFDPTGDNVVMMSNPVTYDEDIPAPTPVVWIGGVPMYAGDELESFYVNGEGMCAFDEPDTWHARLYKDADEDLYTLAINGLNAEGEITGVNADEDDIKFASGIYSSVSLSIVVKGENRVVGGMNLGHSYGIYAADGLSISGNGGTLTALSSDGNSSSNADTYRCGIRSDGDLEISSITLTATGGEADNENNPSYGIGIYAVGNLDIGSARILATGTDSLVQSAGIYADYPDHVRNNLAPTTLPGGNIEIVSGSVVTASAGVALTSGSQTSYSEGIFADGSISVVESEIEAESDYAVEQSHGILAYSSDITIYQGTVLATGGSTGTLYSDDRMFMSYGMRANGAITLDEATVEAYSGETDSNSIALYAHGDLTVTGGSVKAIAAESGLYSWGIDCADLIIEEGARVIATGDQAEYMSYGAHVFGDFHMSGEKSSLTASSGIVKNATAPTSTTRSAGLYMNNFTANGEHDATPTVYNSFTITGGMLKAWCAVGEEQKAAQYGAVRFWDVAGDAITYNDAAQLDDQWYEWAVASDANHNPVKAQIKMSDVEPYIYTEHTTDIAPAYLYIANIGTSEIEYYTVSYVLDGGFNPEMHDRYYDTESVAEGSVVAVKAGVGKEGYDFLGWRGSDGKLYQRGDNITVNDNFVLTAEWKKQSSATSPIFLVGSMTLTNVDAENPDRVIPGAVFELYHANGRLLGTYTTDPNGRIYVYGLTAGTYYWKEIKAAEGYALDATPHAAAVYYMLNTTVVVENERAEVPEVFSGEHYAYVIGFDDGLVHPEATITRAQVATIFFRMLDDETRARYLTRSNSFTDVEEGMWFNTAVSTMAAMDIVKGRTDEIFDPNAKITRAEFAAIASRFELHGNTTDASFTDIYDHWAQKEINIAANNGWVLGYEDGTFRPDQLITRAEAMTMVNRVLQRIPESVDDLLPDMITWADNMDTSSWYYLMIQEATNSHVYSRKESGYEYWTELCDTPDWTLWE